MSTTETHKPVSANMATMPRSQDDMPSVVYTSDSPLRHPSRVVRELFGDLWNSRELVWILFLRDLKAMYRQSFLGYAWIFGPPLATTAVWLFLNSQHIIQVAETPIPYPAYVLVGTMLWSTFSSAISQPLAAFNSAKPVFMKLKVPVEAFIAAGTSRVVFDFLVRFVVVLPALFVFGIYPPITALLFPVAVLCLLLLGTALGMALVPLGALYHDVGRAAGLLVGFVMYLVPVVYPPTKIGWSAKLIDWNPVTSTIMTGRDWLTIGSSEYATPMLFVGVASLFLLLGSMVILRVVMPHLVARMGM